MIKEIDNNVVTLGQVRPNWQMFQNAIPENIIDDIKKLSGEPIEGTTFNNDGEKQRKSKISWIKDKRVLNLLYDFVDQANINAFNVSIYKKADVQFTEYHATEDGHYSWHHDIDWHRNDNLDRKLSITLQLSNSSDYEGGNFQFNEVQQPDVHKLRGKGTVLVFPSYLTHRVTPVTKGIRQSLVAWFDGPKWQ